MTSSRNAAPGEREADLGRAHKAVLTLLLVMVGGEFRGEGVEEEGEAALHDEVEGEGEVVGVHVKSEMTDMF